MLHLILATVGGVFIGGIFALGCKINFDLQNKYKRDAKSISPILIWMVAILSYVISGGLLFFIGLVTILREGVTLLEAALTVSSAIAIFVTAVNLKFIPERLDWK